MGRTRAACLLFSLVFLTVLFAGCGSGNKSSSGSVTAQAEKLGVKVADNKDLYAHENDELENLYVTIVTDNKVTMDDVNAWEKASGLPKPEIKIRFDYEKPAADVSGVTANAVMSQRGRLAATADLKSYKIKLNKTAAEWKGLDTLNLNKHPDDITRIRNKLAFDLIKLFPGTFSCRTQFCHLFIRNLNSGNKEYVDYGLFTNVEDIGKDYLKSRGINKNAYLYKAMDFEFLTYPDVLKNVTDTGYNKVEFEKLLEIEGIEDHARLIQLLKDINDETQDINDVIAKHFDRDNYITWLAINLLLSNNDTNVANFYLLSPLGQDKWYFIPWDYDLALNYNYEIGFESDQWAESYKCDGISMYWNVGLHRRFFKDPENIRDLTAKIEELSAIASDEVVAKMVDKYYSTTNKLVKSSPDTALMVTSVNVYESEVQRLKKALDYGKKTYYDGLKMPMPFDLNEVKVEGDKYTFSWGKSYDLDNDSLHYDFFLSDTPYFEENLLEKRNITDTSVAVQSLKPGTYYWKVEAVDPSGNRQGGLGFYYDPEEDLDYYSIRKLVAD